MRGPRRSGLRRPRGCVTLVRALSKLGLASRTDAAALIAAGRVRVDGRQVRSASMLVVPERAAIAIDNTPVERAARQVWLLHKPRGVVTTRRDPDRRPTVFDLLGDRGVGLVAVGRLDLASTGLLLFTNDTRLADALTDPRRRVTRTYVVTVRGRVSPEAAAALVVGLDVDGPGHTRERLAATAVTLRKASGRESHLLVTLTEGRNREIRRLCAAIGHEVTRLHRVAFGPIALGPLPPGAARPLSPDELAALRGLE